MSVIYVYDGSFEGFLSSLALALEQKRAEASIVRSGKAEAGLFTEIVDAGLDPRKAAGARALIEDRGSMDSWRHVRWAFLTESPGCETAILEYVLLLLEKGPSVDELLADDRVRKVHTLSAWTGGEAHAFKGFVRFRELADKTLYSKIEPDHNILSLLAPHFRARLGTFNWVIHDARRGVAALYFGGRLIYAPLKAGELESGEKEEKVREMWKSFFRIAAIKERTNPRLQRQNVPLKYRRNLTEFE